MTRAEWGLDRVTIGVNETNMEGFQDDFSGMMPDMFTWYQTESAVPRITCNSKGNALEFSRNGGMSFPSCFSQKVKLNYKIMIFLHWVQPEPKIFNDCFFFLALFLSQ